MIYQATNNSGKYIVDMHNKPLTMVLPIVGLDVENISSGNSVCTAVQRWTNKA